MDADYLKWLDELMDNGTPEQREGYAEWCALVDTIRTDDDVRPF